MLNDEKRTTEEAYVSASTTSNMKLGPADGPNRDLDTIIASGLSSSVVGSCLIRLHGEWDRAEKPQAPTNEAIQKLAASLTFDEIARIRIERKLSVIGNLKLTFAVAEKAAKAEAFGWYRDEVAMLLGKLKSFRAAHDALTKFLMNWDQRPEPELHQITLEVLIWWLDRKCKVCNGTKYKTSVGVKRPCSDCRSTGDAEIPNYTTGRRVASYLDDSINDANRLIGARLRSR